MTTETLDITPSPRLLEVLGDIPLAPWQCIAELIDNALDELHKLPERSEQDPLRIFVEVSEVDTGGALLSVSDNGAGMGRQELERALRAGHSDKLRYGTLGLFGMGFNIATARLGTVTTVTTTRRGEATALRATIDLQAMQRSESFHVPVELLDSDAAQSGTTVAVTLKREIAAELTRERTKASIREQLGDVYSYMLRKGVPGLTQGLLQAATPVEVWVDGKRVEPRLPCVWSDSRSVTYRGQEVSAIQYIDTVLPVATACLECGYWDRKNGPEECEECGGVLLEERERRVRGWLGIQRYLDTTDYGVDFIRYGRKIRLKDKSPFVYVDPDTMQEDREYPIEMPANRGRIVGEIHLDHVPVNYQKTDFVRERRDWQTAMELIRGSTGLKKSNAKGEVNSSPLAKLFDAYRRNDVGRRSLIPGSEEGREIHNKAREWGQYFHKGVERFREDTEWFAAIERVERKKAEEARGEADAEDQGGGTSSKPEGGAKQRLLGGTPEVPPASDPVRTRSWDQVMEAARSLGLLREDLGGRFKLGDDLGEWSISVWVTKEVLVDAEGRKIAAAPGAITGRTFEVFLAEDHVLFSEFDRSFRDVALLVSAEMIKGLRGSRLQVHEVYAALVQEVADLRVTRTMLLDGLLDLENRLQQRFSLVAEEGNLDLWTLVPGHYKPEIEEAAAVKFPNDPFLEVTADSRFLALCTCEVLAAIVEKQPELFFDGRVFKPAFAKRSQDGKHRLVNSITASLGSLAAFRQDDLASQKHDLQLARVNLELLNDRIAAGD